MSGRRTILFVTNTLGRAGAEKTLMALLAEFNPERYDISLYSLIPQGEMFAYVPKHVTVLNRTPDLGSVLSAEGRGKIQRQVLRSLLRPRAGGRFLVTLPRNLRWQWKRRAERSGFQLDKLCWELIADAAASAPDAPVKGRYDLAIAFLEGAATYFVARHVQAARKAAFVHVDYTQSGLNPAQDAPFYTAYDAVFGVSRDVLASFVAAHPTMTRKARVFHNRIPAAEIRARAAEGAGFDDGFTGLRLLTVARLHPQKAFDIAIPALRRAIDSGLSLRWYVLGEGPEREKLTRLIERCGLASDFVLLGVRDNPYPYMAGCDIYLQATHYEGWSIALAEALILGRPVIASDCTGNREQIQNEANGLLVPLGEEALAAAIERMARDEALRARFTEALSGIDFTADDEMEMLYTLANGNALPTNGGSHA